MSGSTTKLLYHLTRGVTRRQQKCVETTTTTIRRSRLFSTLTDTSTASSTEDVSLNAVSRPVSSLFMWGTDSSGSLLQPPITTSDTAAATATPKKSRWEWPASVDWRSAFQITDPEVTIRQVVCGAAATAWILSNGRCFVSGDNKQGQLGQGHTNPVPTPVPLVVTDPATNTAVPIREISLGPNFTAVVDDHYGDLYTCGFGGSTFSGLGALGHGDAAHYYVPTRVESLVEDGCSVRHVQAGEAHLTVLTTEGEVLTTGAGSYGRLGDFETRDRLYLEPTELLTPALGITQIAGGKSFTLALASKEGIVYGWGRNHKGQLGTGLGLAVDMYAMQAVPEPIEDTVFFGAKVTQIAAGHSHAACLTECGKCFIWGMALHLEPVCVEEFVKLDIVIKQIACGQDYTLALDENGQLYSWGKGNTGCLAQGHFKTSNQAVCVHALQDYKVKQISAGWKHAACLIEEDI